MHRTISLILLNPMITARLTTALLTTALLTIALLTTGCQQEEKAPAHPVGGAAPISSENEVQLLKGILREDPENLAALIKLGNITMDARRFPEAIEAYGKALDIDPENVNVRVDMGTCYRYSGRPDMAIKEYRKAVSINPNHLNAHKNMGVVLAYDLGDREGAAKAFEAYLRLAPNAPDAAGIKQEIQQLRAK